jgi:hypothetical protein
MPKQIKLGLDKVPAPVTKQFIQLIDIEGNKLVDVAGNPIYTEDEAVVGSFSKSDYSTPVYANNYDNNPVLSIPIAEQFSSESEVSSSLLGVPRSEEQLSLFSDVSTYGLDTDNWSVYLGPTGSYPGEWYRKENPVYGRRFDPKFQEESEEQALSLSSFPSQYAFPGSTIVDKLPSANSTMVAYMNFIAMGKWLYEYFLELDLDAATQFAERNLINRNITIVNASEAVIPISFNETTRFFDNDTNFHDVEYGADLQDSFDQVERWTALYDKIIASVATFPILTGSAVTDFTELALYKIIQEFLQEESRPGGSSIQPKFAILESKKTFRYQPGRASGFTFGVRQETDPTSPTNTIEWGCSNSTDEYMFQLVGSKFNIVRRSTIKLPDDLLLKQGLAVSDQGSSPIETKGVEVREAMWETVIPRTKFNGDKLLGGGDSGYILSFEDVTMYKIEFSWYGAIGAKFYAYVPVNNGEARWVLMHRLIIENGLGLPILNNPDFKFKYLISTEENKTMEKPVVLYKYGSSYYVDGGDEGTIRLATTTVDTKSFSGDERTPILGILPKQEIFNQDGVGIPNFKKAYPTTMSISSSIDTRVDIEEIRGSPDGVHYNFSPSLHNGVHPNSRTLTFQAIAPLGSQLNILGGDNLTLKDDKAHLIADGVYNAYVNFDSNLTNSTVIRRRTSSQTLSSPISFELKGIKADGTLLDTSTGPTFTGRLSNYHAIAASTVPIYSNNFKIHFLNPRSGDGSKHFADFAVSVTSKVPEIDTTVNPNVLKFEDAGGVKAPYSLYDELHQEYSSEGTAPDYSVKADKYEWDPGLSDMFMVDYRLGSPEGPDSGYISTLIGEVRILSNAVSSVTAITSGQFSGKWRINFDNNNGPDSSLFTLDSSGAVVPQSTEVGVGGVGIGVYYHTVPITVDGEGTFAYVDGDPTNGGNRTVASVNTKIITIKDDWQLDSDLNGDSFNKSKAVKFNSQPLYLVFALKDNAKVNNIIVEEFTPETVRTHTPVFIKDASTLTIVNSSQSGGPSSSNALTPAAFQSDNRLSSVRFDDQCLNPLRPGTVIYSLYVKGGSPEKFDLSNIFNRDRKGIARGLLNNRAVYLTASAVDGLSVGNIEMTLTVKEQ